MLTPARALVRSPHGDPGGEPEGAGAARGRALLALALIGAVGVPHAQPAGAVTYHTVKEFSAGITADSFVREITAGADGNLWFTELVGARIGRITPAGSVHEFSAGISGYPEGITSGPDGDVSFTEIFPPMVARITPSGAVTEFPVEQPSSGGPTKKFTVAWAALRLDGYVFDVQIKRPGSAAFKNW